MQNASFHDIELESWGQRAAYYDTLFGDVTAQAIDDMLDSLGTVNNTHHLDMACGTGHLVRAASERGAHSQGIDFSQPMIDVARLNYPTEKFELADATRLPYENEMFDSVTCSFGLSHMENPQAVVNEAYRVLKPQGRFVFTLWYGPDEGNEVKTIVREAFQKHGTPSAALPMTWTQLRSADTFECNTLVTSAGFLPPTFKILPMVFYTSDAQKVVDFAEKLSVRTRLLLDRHDPDAQQRIRDHILCQAESRRSDVGVISLDFPALLTVAQKPE